MDPLKASSKRAAKVSELQPGAHVHLLGICGTGMAAALALLKERGFKVTGSDTAFYPPMGELVRDLADQVYEGYRATNLEQVPALIVVGNAIREANPEFQASRKKNIPYASMPEVFRALLIGSRDFCGTSVVVAGTHGKTTTTAMTAYLLEHAGLQPGYFIGGQSLDFKKNIRGPDLNRPGKDRVVVLEGDEYDSAWFAKWPKFLSYRPDILVITSLEFDHADIYESLDDIKTQFTSLAGLVPAEGLILVCDTSPELVSLVADWHSSPDVKAGIELYGLSPDSNHQLIERKSRGTSCERVCYSVNKDDFEAELNQLGEYNALNALAAVVVARRLSVPLDKITTGLKAFKGVKRRQQVLAVVDGITVIEDFAHHPTAVGAMLEALKEHYFGERIVAVFEPRSNTSRRDIFQADYLKSLAKADVVIVQEVASGEIYSNTGGAVRFLDVKKLCEELSRAGRDAHAMKDADEILDWLLAELKAGDVVVLMSNGAFGGLAERLPEGLLGK